MPNSAFSLEGSFPFIQIQVKIDKLPLYLSLLMVWLLVPTFFLKLFDNSQLYVQRLHQIPWGQLQCEIKTTALFFRSLSILPLGFIFFINSAMQVEEYFLYFIILLWYLIMEGFGGYLICYNTRNVRSGLVFNNWNGLKYYYLSSTIVSTINELTHLSSQQLSER